MFRAVLSVYLLIVHVVLAWLFQQIYLAPSEVPSTKPAQPELSAYYHRILAYHERSVRAVPDEAVLLIGDSITQGLCACSVTPNAVNYGIGSDTTVGVIERIPVYGDAVSRAKAIVIAIGLNDIKRRSNEEIVANMEVILDLLEGRRVVLSAIHPIDSSARKDMDDHPPRIVELNHSFAELASSRDSVVYVDAGPLLDANNDGTLDVAFHVGDGVHLNNLGNTVWAIVLRDATDQLKSK